MYILMKQVSYLNTVDLETFLRSHINVFVADF